MKISIEPKKLEEFLDKVLVGGQSKAFDMSGLANVELTFNDKGCHVNDVSLGGIAVLARFKPEYFTDFEIAEQETMIASNNILNLVKKLFRGDETVDIKTTTENDSNIVLITGKNDKIREISDTLKVEKLGNLVIDDELGLIPDPNRKNAEGELISKRLAIVRIDKSQLDLPSLGQTKLYNFKIDNKELRVVIKDETTKITRKIPIIGSTLINDLDVTFDGKYFDKMLKILPVEVWLSIYSQVILLSINTEHYCITYFLTKTG